MKIGVNRAGGAGNMGTIPQALPPPPKRSTLIERLKKLAEDQREDADVIADMEMQW